MLLEAGLLAVVASLVGVLAGIGIAAGILALFQALDLALPTVPLVLTPGTLLPGLIVGTVVTVLAAARARDPRHAHRADGGHARSAGPSTGRPAGARSSSASGC